MLEAESDRRTKRQHSSVITQADLDAKNKDGLCNPISIELYFTWQSFGGGMGASLSLSEILAMPSWLRKDFRYLHRLIGEIRQDREASELWFAEKEKTKP